MKLESAVQKKIIQLLEIFQANKIFVTTAIAVLSIFLFDFVIRYNYLTTEMSGKDTFFYILSALFEFALLSFLLTLRIKNILLIPFIIFYVFIIAGSYGFYTFFNTLPGINTFAFMFLTPQNSYTLFVDSLSVLNVSLILLTIAATSYTVIKFRKRIQFPNNKIRIVILVLVILFALVLKNNTRLADNRILPFSNAVFSVIHGYKASQAEGSLTKLGYRTYQPNLVAQKRQFDYNIIYIMSESINPFLLTEYGYDQQFMPKTSTILEENNAVIFKKMFSNATITAVSVPFAVAGLNPIEGREKLLSTPMIYDLIKENFSNMKTAIISSWSYDDYPKFKDFFSSKNLDCFIFREMLDAEKVCDMGADDSLIAGCLEKFIGALNSDENFFSFLHFSNTHYPYYSKSKEERNLPNEISKSYANSLTTFDENLSAVFSLLKQKKILDKTIIFFTSDHSEQLGLFGDQFGHYGKFSIWNCAVPAWCIFPKNFLNETDKNQLIENAELNTSNNDIIPTLCNIMKLKFRSPFGNSLLNSFPNERKIYIYNGLGENRTDNKDYFGIIFNDEFFISTKRAGEFEHNIYSIEDRAQKHDLFSSSKNARLFQEITANVFMNR